MTTNPPSSPWKRLSTEQLQGAEFAVAYLRTSVVIRGEALKVVDEVRHDIRTELTARLPISIDDVNCPRGKCPENCRVWERCRAKDTKKCPMPTNCLCMDKCEYFKSQG